MGDMIAAVFGNYSLPQPTTCSDVRVGRDRTALYESTVGNPACFRNLVCVLGSNFSSKRKADRETHLPYACVLRKTPLYIPGTQKAKYF